MISTSGAQLFRPAEAERYFAIYPSAANVDFLISPHVILPSLLCLALLALFLWLDRQNRNRKP